MGSTTTPAASALSSAPRFRKPGARACAASNPATALPLFSPPLPSISPGEKPARSRRTCISSSVVSAAGIDGPGRFVANDVNVPRRIATLAARHERVLNVNFVALLGGTISLLLAKMLHPKRHQFISSRSAASVQDRTH